MKKRISIIMLLTISVLMTGCEELHKKPLAYIETNADDRQSETSETETKKKKETEPETEAVEVVEQGSLETERPETETESETEEDKTEDAASEGELPVLEKTDKTSEEIEMENILQNPELPTGCESVALTMVLKYLGFDLEKTTIADDYLVFADRNLRWVISEIHIRKTGPVFLHRDLSRLQIISWKHREVKKEALIFQILTLKIFIIMWRQGYRS